DGRLVALDAKTGQPVWSVMTVDPDKAYTNTMAPRVIKGRVMIGVAGSEYGVRGYISAYDAETGALAWRFYTVPGDPSKGFENKAMEMAAKTWHGEWWKMGGGGTVWVATSYDPKLNLIYFGAGNGSVWNQHYRSDSRGDNLLLSSIIALNADTGAYVWHYQAIPGEEDRKAAVGLRSRHAPERHQRAGAHDREAIDTGGDESPRITEAAFSLLGGEGRAWWGWD